MCQANVYMVRDGQREELMKEVTRLVPVDEGLRLETFFEAPLVVPGRVVEIDFLRHTVTLEPLDKREG